MVLQVPPTLVAAARALAHDTVRGFTFVRPDGSERHLPFAEICSEAERRAGHFVARGLSKGQRVALVIPDGDEFVLSFLGATFAGLVPVPIYPQLSFKNVAGYHETVRHIVKASGARFLLTTATTKPYVDPVLEASPSAGSEPAFLERIETVDAFAGPASEADVARARAVDVHPDDLAFLQFTSGSTARPKGVAVTHGNLAANSEAFMIHGLGKDSSVDKGVSWLPLFHDMGLIGFVIGPLFTDIPVVFLPTASFVRAPRLWLETIHKHRGTITYAPNFAYALVSKRLKDKEVEAYDLSCLRRAGCGAEPIQAKTLREFASKLAPAKFDPRAFLPSYGMAEATLAVSFVPKWTGVRTDIVDARALETKKAEPASLDTILRAEKGDTGSVRELVNCGGAFPGHEIAIVDEDGKPLGDRRVGEIITRGPSICQGYYQEPELTAAVFKDGWLHTGDLGYLVDGEVFICGRAKDIIIVRGRNFYPSDIEWTVSELPGIRRGNVVAFSIAVDTSGAPTLDGAGDDQLVICAEGFQSDAAALAETIKSTVAAEHGLAVHDVVVVPQGTLPRTSSGKPQRRKTKQMYQAAELPRAQPVQRGDSADVSA